MKSVNVREDREVVHLSDGLECLCPIVESIFLEVLQHYKQLWFVMTVGHSVITMWLHCDNSGTWCDYSVITVGHIVITLWLQWEPVWLHCDYSGTRCDYSWTQCDNYSVPNACPQRDIPCSWFNLYFINCKFKTILLYIKIMAKVITFVVYQVTSPHTMLHYDKMLLHISQSA